ncbi:MAG: M42 family metallopeptidase [Planctomycetota bacterium]|nr:M42 family metallopeptidase [Planctomycetota bacterium]MDI6787350.1 M42 family metallopeptidase [Planctomycetota bacterium]
MEIKSLNFLKELVDSPSPSGYEQPAQGIWCKYVRPFVDEIKKDVHGNAIAVINPHAKFRLMLCGHCDEIGLMVNYIDDKGYIYVRPIGGIDTAILPGQRFYIHTRKGPVLGVIGKKAIHLMEEEERKSAGTPKIHTLWLDIGARTKDEVEKIISIGDPITFAAGLDYLKNGLVVARGFDDKMGSFVVAETMRLISRKKPQIAVFGVSTVQEEIGARGVRTSAFGISPDVGIAIDVTHATDYPDANAKKTGEITLGKGPAISRGANINPIVFDKLVSTARANRISYQIKAEPIATPTDANAIQLNKAGVATGLVSVPNRYMHTPVEIIALSDLENTAKLLASFTYKLAPKMSFIP